MKKIKNSLSSKVLTLVIVLAIILGAIPPAIVSAETDMGAMGTISGISEGGVVDGNNITFSNVDLEWVEKDTTIGRNQDGWWVGVKITAPSSFTAEQLKDAVYFAGGTEQSFWANKDSVDDAATHYMDVWVLVNEAYLNDAIARDKMLSYTYKFDWDNDDNYEQPICIKIDPANTELKNGSETVYPTEAGKMGLVEAVTEGITLSSGTGNFISAENTSTITVNWSEAGVGKASAGWWVGVKVYLNTVVSLDDVSFQYKVNSNWSEDKPYKDIVDTSSVGFLYAELNASMLETAKKNGEKLDYQWRIDWNNDGVYEQHIQLEIDPSKVILIDENGGQAYPAFGTVTGLTGGTVSGDDNNIELTIEETTLNWSPADPSIGRNTDGWWVGMLVVAPSSKTAEQLKNATYKSRATKSGGSEWSEYSSAKSFWDYKDSADDSSSHYIQMWMPLTPSLLTTYQNKGNNVKGEYVFDWDNDGVDDQTITMIVVPSDKIVLNKVAQTDFGFETPNPVGQWNGATYRNEAIGGQGSGAVTYSIISGDEYASIDATSGTLTFTDKVGTIVVQATKASDDVYDEATAQYSVTSYKNPVTGFVFVNTQITVPFSDGSYTNSLASEGEGNGNIEYSIISGSDVATIDAATGKVTFVTAGEVTVKAEKKESASYLSTSTTYILKIEESEQVSLNITNEPAITYNPAAQNGFLTVTGGSGTIAYKYEIVEGSEYASIDPATGAITTLKAGGTFKVKVTNPANGGYKVAEKETVAITVLYADQVGFDFTEKSKAMTYGDEGNTFTVEAKGGQSEKAVVYESSDTNIAEVDNTGKVTVKAAGEVEITAIKAQDDKYKEAKAVFKLTVSAAAPEFTVNDADLKYGIQDYQIVPVTVKGSGNYEYAISATDAEGNPVTNDLDAVVDATGRVGFAEKKTGSVYIKVKIVADSQYQEAYKIVKITVSHLDVTAQPTVEGAKINADSVWYTGDITIKAPEGYLISDDNSFNAVWQESITYSEENSDGKKVVYLKNDQGVSDAITVEGLFIDKTAPSDLKIEYTTPDWQNAIAKLFGYKNTTEAKVILTAKDSESGIESFVFNYGDNATTTEVKASGMTIAADGKATYTFTVSEDYRDKINFVVKDVAGHQVELKDDKELVVDHTAPELVDVYYTYKGSYTSTNSVIYTNNAVTATFEIKESNFDISLLQDADKPKVILYNNPLAVVWEETTNGSGEKVWKATCNIDVVGDHKLSLSYTDKAENTAISYEKDIHYDTTAPVFDVSFDNNSALNENNYKADRIATVKVTEHNFNPADVVLSVVAKDITGAPVDISAKKYADYATNSANWTHDGDVWTLNTDGMKFDIDAIYTITLDYTDLAGNDAQQYATEFVVDKTAPENIKIEYSTPVAEKVLDVLTFGFYKEKVEMTVTAEDITAGVDYFEISYIQEDGANNSNKPSYKSEKLAAVQNSTDKNVFTATYEIPAEARGKITVDVTDKAGNSAQFADKKVIVVDNKAPGLEVSSNFAEDKTEFNNIYYTKGKVTLVFTIDEANFDVAEKPVVTVNGIAHEVIWTQVEGTDKWVGSLTLSENGDYIVSASFKDSSDVGGDHTVTYTQEIHIDSEAPMFDVTYDNNSALNENNYKADRTATVKVTEHNFNPAEAVLSVTAKDITGAPVDISAKKYEAYAKNSANWSKDGDVWTLNTDGMKFDIDAIYTITLDYTDLAGNDAQQYATEFVVDKTAPENIKIEYSTPVGEKTLNAITFGFYKEKVEMTVTAEDITAGVDYFEITYNQEDGANNSNKPSYKSEKLAAVQNSTDKNVFTATYEIPAEARGKITVDATDKAGNSAQFADEKVLVVDNIAPGLEVSSNFAEGKTEFNNIYYTKGKVTLVFTIDEANFDVAEKPVVTVNSVAQEVIWTQVEGTDKWVGEIALSENGDYIVSASFKDSSDEKADHTVTYTQEIHIQDAASNIDVSYDNNTALNGNNYKADRKATIKITEHNFASKDVELYVEAKNILGEDVAGYTYFTADDGKTYVKEFYDFAKSPDNWSSSGDDRFLKTDGMLFGIDAKYKVTFIYKNLVGTQAETYVEEFVIDKTTPENIKIEYSTPVAEKVLDVLTFGFYKEKVEMTVTAEDITAGVDYFEITYNQEDGANNSNKPSYKSEKLAAVQNSTDKNVFTATYEIPAEARGKITVDATDKAGNSAQFADEKVLVVDNIAPELTVEYAFTSGASREFNEICYTQSDVKATFTIEEANFDVAAAPVVTVNSEAQNVSWSQVENTDKWVGEITLTGDGDYIVNVTFKDSSDVEGDHTVTYTKEIHIDSEAPTFDVTYDNNSALNENNYKADRTATVKVTEHNFNPAEVVLSVVAKDITGAPVDISAKKYEAYAKNSANWSKDGDVWTLNADGMKFNIDAIYTITLDYTDLAGNDAQQYATEFVVDKTKATNVNISYSQPVLEKVIEAITFGYYKADVTVTLTADDITSGVDYFEWTYTKQAGSSDKNAPTAGAKIEAKDIVYSNNGKSATAVFTILAQARGHISVDVTDKAGNVASLSDDKKIVVTDTIAPTRVVKYAPERIFDAATMKDVDTFNENDNVILYYKNSAVVTFVVDEANFYAEDVVIKVNGKDVAPTDWTQNGDVWTGTITISGDGDYYVTMSYTDRSSNKMVDYTSQKIAIDSTIPVLTVEYDNNTALNNNNYKADRTATITVVEHNFRADDVAATITARDIQGTKVSVQDYKAYLSDRANWVSDGDTHVAKITYSTDAIYTFDIEYSDIIGNKIADYKAEEFVVDHSAPTALKISYNQSVIEKIVEKITFGFYKPSVTVTLTADDITSGVDYFDWTYTQQTGTSEKNTKTYGEKITAKDITYSNDGKSATAVFTIPANARGYISASVTDRAGNVYGISDNGRINVVDSIAPNVSVEYTADSKDTKVQFTDDKFATVDSFGKATNAYYNGDVTATIIIDEANFFEGIKAADGVIYQVGIKLTKTDDNGNVTITEFLPEGATQRYAGAKAEYIKWETIDDKHTFKINYKENADYVLEIDYTDISENQASLSANDGVSATKQYKSKNVTVDKVAPVVSVDYANQNVIHTIDGRDYFDAKQIATITVNEHNFRADDFVAVVEAKDVVGADIVVENFAKTLSDDSNWTKDGNVYTITIEYPVDANYKFDYTYKDLAENVAADYEQDVFTVDKTAPEKLTVSYSTSVLDKVLESVTFGYYNAKMTVTISAEDDVSGVHYFVYSYIKSAGVSAVNAELINDKIADANKAIVYDGAKATTSFTIPKLLLKNDNQFNGTVEFVAYDRAENNTKLADNRRVIVDNIAPTATITYSKPVQVANGISYYAGNIDATIVVKEANFYKEDIAVSVTRNGNKYPVAVKWVDNSVDVHTGTFTFTEDGDYIVTIEYTDRSANAMTTYVSNRLTRDTKIPSVNVSNIRNNSANNDDVFGFTITATDINIDSASFRPVLTAVVRNEDGSFDTRNISLGAMRTVKAGESYSYTLNNIEQDAMYSLSCTLKDMSGNAYSKIVLADGREYDNVRFSVNRDGSTFAVNADTQSILDKYYVQSVVDDIVVEETNVDPVESYTVKINGKVLTEGKDYTSVLSDRAGEWSKRAYIISKANFEAEGEYSIVIESTDKTETTAYSDVKNLKVAFVVDQTAPKLTISGLENGGRYQVAEQTVTVIPTDDGGRLYSIKVLVMDSDGKPLKDESGKDISVRFDMSGEEFLEYLNENDGKISFTIPEGLENQVQIICNDCAVNEDGKTNEYKETFVKATVSQSDFVIFYANKPLFFGSIAGVAALIGLIIFIVIFKKRKKEEKE